MATIHPTSAPSGETSIPAHSASGAPVTRAYRVAFQIWVLCFLLTIVTTLLFYLFDKLSLAFSGH